MIRLVWSGVCVCVKVGKNKRNEGLDGLESEATSGTEL